MMKRLKNWFHKKHQLSEEMYIKDVISHNEKDDQDKLDNFYKGVQVVLYQYVDDETFPRIIRLFDFHGDYLPKEDSVIYGPDADHKYFVRYRVKRIDYMEDEEDGIPSKHLTLIVVEPMDINEE